MKKIEDAVEMLVQESGIPIVGCSDSEVDALEARWNRVLPQIYKVFLRLAGKCPGDLLDGCDWAYEDLEHVRSSAEAQIEDMSGPAIPDSAFVFLDNQSYQFLFFHCGEGEDPEVYRYNEGDDHFEKVAESFSTWFADAVRDFYAEPE